MLHDPLAIIKKSLFSEMISAEQLHVIVETKPVGVVLLDVRTEIEFQEGVIPGSHLYPCDHNLENREDMARFLASFEATFRKEQFDPKIGYILICRSGPRTEIALAAFLQHGLQACELMGGVEEWKRQNYSLVSADSALRVPR